MDTIERIRQIKASGSIRAKLKRGQLAAGLPLLGLCRNYEASASSFHPTVEMFISAF